MPAPPPLGRAIVAHFDFVSIWSPMAPVVGLVASQLYSFACEVLCPAS